MEPEARASARAFFFSPDLRPWTKKPEILGNWALHQKLPDFWETGLWTKNCRIFGKLDAGPKTAGFLGNWTLDRKLPDFWETGHSTKNCRIFGKLDAGPAGSGAAFRP